MENTSRKNFIRISVFIFLIFKSYAFSQGKIRIAVMDFQAVNISKSTATIVTDMIRTEIINAGNFLIIERSQVALILQETGFQQSGCTDENCAVKIGKMLSAKKLLIGTISKLGNKIIINGRLVDVEKGISEFGENVISDSEDELAKAVKLFASNLSSRIKGIIPDTSEIEAEVETPYNVETSYNVNPAPNVEMESRFFDNGNGRITDKKTGLIWQKEPSPKKMTYGDALSYLRSLSQEKSTPWRIPDKDELSTLLIGGTSRSCDKLRERGFIHIRCENYWTKSLDSSRTDSVWCIDIGSDMANSNSKDGKYFIWAVCGGK